MSIYIEAFYLLCILTKLSLKTIRLLANSVLKDIIFIILGFNKNCV